MFAIINYNQTNWVITFTDAKGMLFTFYRQTAVQAIEFCKTYELEYVFED